MGAGWVGRPVAVVDLLNQFQEILFHLGGEVDGKGTVGIMDQPVGGAFLVVRQTSMQ